MATTGKQPGRQAAFGDPIERRGTNRTNLRSRADATRPDIEAIVFGARTIGPEPRFWKTSAINLSFPARLGWRRKSPFIGPGRRLSCIRGRARPHPRADAHCPARRSVPNLTYGDQAVVRRYRPHPCCHEAPKLLRWRLVADARSYGARIRPIRLTLLPVCVSSGIVGRI